MFDPVFAADRPSGGNVRRQVDQHAIDTFDPDSGDRGRSIWGFYSQFDPFPLVAWNSTFTRSVRSERDNRVVFSGDVSIETAHPQTTLIAWSPDDTMIATSFPDFAGLMGKIGAGFTPAAGAA